MELIFNYDFFIPIASDSFLRFSLFGSLHSKLISVFVMESSKKFRLNEVALMRMILAILIVFWHSFNCYNHSWPEPAGFIEVPLYKWLARISFVFTLEAFVFISGYLFAFQRITLKRTGGVNLIVNKLKRLILPSIIFSIIYFAIFYE